LAQSGCKLICTTTLAAGLNGVHGVIFVTFVIIVLTLCVDTILIAMMVSLNIAALITFLLGQSLSSLADVINLLREVPNLNMKARSAKLSA